MKNSQNIHINSEQSYYNIVEGGISIHMKDGQNFKWTMYDIAHQYKLENSSWSWSECWQKARIIYIELNRMNNQMWKDNKLFFEQNTPFSFFESEDRKWSSIPELKEV